MSTNRIEVSLAQYCEMTVSGIIAPDERDPNKLVLITPDGCQFRAAPLGGVSIGEGHRQWRVIPIMQTDGNITRVQIVEEQSPPPEADKFVCVGRTNQVSHKHNIVTLKIDRQGEPTIRPTFFNPPETIQSGQLWQIIAQRVGNTLEILTATQLDNLEVAQAAVKSLPSVAPKTVYNARNLDRERKNELTPIALAALNKELKERDWELSLTRVKEPTWEWEAQSLVPTDLRARVQVNARTQVARVYV